MKTQRIVLGIVGVAAVLALWELLTRGPLSNSPLPAFSSTLVALVGLFGDPGFWQAVVDTVLMAAVGLVVSVALGVVLGLLIASSSVLHAASRVVVEFLKPIPPIVVLPVVVLVAGPTLGMGVILVMIGCVIAVLMQTVAGVRETDPVAVDSGRSYGLGRLERVWRIVLPSTLPYIGMSIRVCAPVSLLVSVVAGLLGGGPGIGQSILRSQMAGDQPRLFALVLVLGVMGLLVQGITNATERRVLHWHPAYRPEVR
ncbi:MAG: ABC transporter permease [Pseudoclavibacter sp.]